MSERAPIRFSHLYAACVEGYIISGMTTNAEIASVIRAHFDDRVTERDVARWRKQNWRFEKACSFATHSLAAEMTNIVVQSAREGNVNDAKWLLERRAPAFMPKSKLEHAGNVTTLDDSLRRRAMSEDEARDRGLIYDPEPEPDEDPHG